MQPNQRLGLTMLIATLLVMVAIAYLVFDQKRSEQEAHARNQGLDLVRLLASISWEELAPQTGRKDYLEIMSRGQSNSDFAYGVIVDLNGQIIAEVTRPGVIVPQVPISDEPTGWLGQRVLPQNGTDRIFIESHAPMFAGDRHMGFVRLGYFKPVLDPRNMPLMALMMLFIFLLMPLFYFMMRREIKPLIEISERFEKLAGEAGMNEVELQPSQALNEFMEQFSSYIDATQTRIEALNVEHEDLVMSSKLLTYRNNRIDAILQNFPDAIMVIDEAGDVSYVNAKIDMMLGVDPEDILGKGIREWCDDPQILPLLTFGDVKTSLQSNQDTILHKNDDGRERYLLFDVYPLFVPNDESKILGRLVVIRDVTESHELRQRQNEFISHISHELKTPLNVLSMYSESLLTQGVDEEYRVEAVNVIRDEVERLSTLINNLLAINQYELGTTIAQRQYVRTNEFLEDAFENIRQSRGTGDLEFHLEVPREMSMAYIDKDLFRIAINNLLTNAIKYNKPGGSITLSAWENEEFLEIVVSDEGYGISEEDQNQIFDKFFRSPDENIRKQAGHGLGLALARQIVLMHHGDLSFTSELGKGSQFRIRLEKLSTQLMETAS